MTTNVKISALPASAGLDGTEIVPIVDGGVTQRTTTADIAALSGGGSSGFIDLIQIFSNASFSTVTEAGDDLIPLDPTANGGVTYRLQGTSLSWGGIGNESKIVVGTTGYYTVHSVLVCSPGTEGMSFTTTLFLNGSPLILGEFGPSWLDLLASGGVSSHTVLVKYPFTAGDVIEAHATQVGNISNDNQVGGYYLVVSRDL